LNDIPTPAVLRSRVIITSRYNQRACAMFAIQLDGTVTEVWRVRQASGVCSPLVHDEHVYWANKALHCHSRWPPAALG
jgi:hypothetical protein